jgi:small-conductance mechanosensitive channel
LWFALGGLWAGLEWLPLGPPQTSLLRPLLFIAVTWSVTIVISRLGAGYVTRQAARVRGVLPSTTIFGNIARAMVYVVGALVTLQTLGISITPILTALGVGGLAVALALQDTLSNLFSGLQIIASGQLKPGDFVRLDSGEEGFVVDITWRNTTIRQLSNSMVIVPNAHLAASRVTNFDRPDKSQAVLIEVGVAYDSDLQHVERVTAEVGREVLKRVEGGVLEFEPFVRYHTFGKSSIDFTVILRAKAFVDQYLIRHEFIKRLQDRYRDEQIEIPFPIQTVHFRRPDSVERPNGFALHTDGHRPTTGNPR